MAKFSHIIESGGFAFEVTGDIDVDKGADSVKVNSIVEYRDPYGIGLGIKRREVDEKLKAKIEVKFAALVKELFAERDVLLKEQQEREEAEARADAEAAKADDYDWGTEQMKKMFKF